MLQSIRRAIRLPTDRKSLLGWLITLRWILLPLQFLSLIPGIIIGFVDSSNLMYYVMVMASFGAFNYFAQIAYMKNPEPTPLKVFVNLTFDMLQLSVLLAMTGGWNNPFSSLLFVSAVFGAILLTGVYRRLFVFIMILAILLLHHYFSYEIVNNYPWTEYAVNFAVETIVIIAIMNLVSSLFKQILKQSERLNALKENQLRMDRLRAIGALSAGVCHQIATPINNLKIRVARLERIVNRDTDIDCSEDFASLQRSLTDTESAVRRLAQVHKRPGEEIWHSEILETFLQDAVKGWQQEGQQQNVSVQLVASGDWKVNMPSGAVQQVLTDLLDNCMEAMDGVGNITITVTDSPDRNLLQITFEDEGPGFDQDIVEALGEPFNSSKERGSGLGLYHARIVANLLGGDIFISNRSPKGARVTFALSKEFVIV
ncbi:MAG: HAMP domain-containing histidine kinase [Pseudobacteriovorax sp.]|nr:HAMP domain-containing histidine kinase [Pseudobacteriovorax sp.]